MTGFRDVLRHLAVLIGAAFGVAGAGAAARADTPANIWHANEDDSLLLELRSGQYRLGEPLRGYQTPTGICVDFADLIQALDLPVRLDKKSRRATGCPIPCCSPRGGVWSWCRAPGWRPG